MRWSVFLPVCLVALLICVASAVIVSGQAGVSSASFSMARAGLPSDPDAVRIEEFVNYHRHQIPEPMGAVLALDARWGAPACGPPQAEAVLQVGLAATRSRIESDKVPPLNLALVIDQSGSMEGKRIAKVKEALLAFLDKLRPGDRVSIVGFSSEAHVVLPSASPPDHKKLRQAVSGMQADGSTNLHAGLMLGYEQVADQYDANKTNRVILLTDGMANAGVTDEEQIVSDSLAYNDRDIDLSTIGVGNSFNHRLMRSLSDAGRGLMHFVGDEKDIQKTFVEELESLLAPIARRVSVEIEYDEPLECVQVYGYEPRRDGRKITVDLADLNHGATQVILARFRAPPRSEPAEMGVAVRLRYYDVADRGIVVDERRAALAYDPQLPADAPLLEDPFVRKSETIAELAQGIKQMARVAAAADDPVKAGAELTGPLAMVNQRYPDLADKDIARVRDMLVKYRDLLAKESKRKEEFERKAAIERKKALKAASAAAP